MVILGIDPGSITTGYAFLKKTGNQIQVLEYGTFHANATKNLEDRLVHIVTELEKRLDPRQFVRVHRAHLVAIDYIAEIRKTDSGRLCIVLRDKNRTQITVSRNFVKTVKSL